MTPRHSTQWVPLEQLATLSSGSTPSRRSAEFFGGDVPWVKTGDLTNGIVRSTEECVTEVGRRAARLKLYPPGAVLIAMYGGFRQIGRTGLLEIGAATNQAITAIECNANVLEPRFLLALLNARNDYWRGIATSSRKDPNITRADVARFPVPLLPLPAQRFIADLSMRFEEQRRQLARLIALKRAFRHGVSRQLLSGRIRLPAFARTTETQTTDYGQIPADWRYVRIGDIARESVVRAGDSHAPVLSCTKHGGFVDSVSYFGRRVYSKDTSNYRLIRRGEFGFPSNHVEEGSIGFLTTVDEGRLSPIYVVFGVAAEVSGDYLFELFKSETYRHIFATATNSSVNRRGSLRWDHFARIAVPLPSIDEQRHIANLLALLGRELSLLEQLASAFDRQHRALLARLLAGDVMLTIP